MKEEQRISIKLSNGDELVAETCPREGGQIAVGIVRDGMWIQDLSVIETEDNYMDKYKVYVYSNEYDECYTDSFCINRVPSNAL